MAQPRLYYPESRAILQVILEGFGGPSSTPKVIPILPISSRVHRNSYNQPDSFSITFDALDFPVQPEMIDSGAVELYIFQNVMSQRTVSSRGLSEFDFDNLRETKNFADRFLTGFSRSIEADAFTMSNRPMIVGLFDEASIEWGGGGNTFTIDGQDYTALLQEKLWPLEGNRTRVRKIPVGKRLDRLLEQLLREAEPLGRMALTVRGVPDKDLPVVGAEEVRHHRTGIPVDPQSSYWDVMCSLASRYGLVLYVEDLSVVLTNAHTINDTKQQRIRKMIYGHNLSRMHSKRKLGKERVPSIEVRSYNPKLRKTHVGRYPPHSTKVQKRKRLGEKRKRSGTSQHERDEVQVMWADGITSEELLTRSARAAYERIGRGEMVTVIETSDLKDLDGDDLLNLRAGDPLIIEVAGSGPIERVLGSAQALQEKVAYLVSRGFNASVAQVFAQHYERFRQTKVPFRVRSVSFDYNVSSGVKIEAELISYVRVDGRAENFSEGDE